MILVIDTSSAINALAILDVGFAEQMFLPARSPQLVERMRAMATAHTLTRIAVATGPGSFTGVRMGVSFALGLAIGLRVPIVPLPTLELQAARSDMPTLAVSEAGRGRVYYLEPGGRQALAELGDVARDWPVVGWLQPSMEAALQDLGHRFQPDSELRPFVEAAAQVLKTARDVPYGSLKLEYMQSFAMQAK